MYKAKDKKQFKLEDFYLPFGGHLNQNNRWVQLSEIIPWDDFEEQYEANFPVQNGNMAKPFRMALGSLLIKEKLGVTDRETVAQIQENPYLQYFIGFESYTAKEPFDSSLMVHFRKRITSEMINDINEHIHHEQVKKNRKKIQKLKKKKKLR